MQEFDFSVEYRPGINMAHVDARSHNPVEENCQGHVDIVHVLLVEDDAWLETVQSQDQELKRMIEILRDPKSEKVLEIKNNFTIKNDRLYRIIKKRDDVTLLWVVPKSVRFQIVRMNHDNNGHFGFEKIYDRIKRVYWFN